VVDNGWGAAWSDMDADGDLDLVTRRLFRNDLENDNHWLEVRLEGTVSNRSAIGARVDVSCGGTTFSRQVEGGKGTMNQSSLTLHFGLGGCAAADLVTVTWPSGLVETLENVDADRLLHLLEGSVDLPEEEEAEAAPDEDMDASTDMVEDPDAGEEEPFDLSGGGCGCAAAS
jgi:hypothetical protein